MNVGKEKALGEKPRATEEPSERPMATGGVYHMKMSYQFGDWVVYDPGYKTEIGRVTECRDRSAFVCYHQGCTATSTPLEHLRPATDAEIAKAPAGIGFHRFDATCPNRDEECCYMCKAVRA